MEKIYLIGFVAAVSVAKAAAAQSSFEQRAKASSIPTLVASTLSTPVFIENKGQFDSRVKFQVKIGPHLVWLTRTGIVFDATRLNAEEKATSNTKTVDSTNGNDPLRQFAFKRPEPESHTIERLVFSEDFAGASCCSNIEGKNPQSGMYNYFQSKDPKEWHTNVRGFAEVVYHDVWPGVDLRIYGNGSDLEQEFLVQPDGNLNRVQISYRGTDGLTVAKDGSLEIGTPFGKLHETPPRLYQSIAGKQVVVDGRFELTSRNSYTFRVGEHAAQYTLVIDPTLLYSTFLGGHTGDAATGIAVDASGSSYIVGYTGSTDFPTTIGAFQTTNSSATGQTTFVTKLNPSGSGLIYSTYFGGPTRIQNSIAVDAAGQAYISGVTVATYYGGTFPTTSGAYATRCSPSDGFVTVLNAQGNGLVYSTCLGASAEPTINAIATDSSGRAVIAGTVSSQSIPTTANAYQSTYPGARGSAAFIMMFDTTASGTVSLVYSTYFGIPSSNFYSYGVNGNAVAVDSYGDIYVTGSSGDGLPVTAGVAQASLAGGIDCNQYGGQEWICPDAFLAKFNPSVSGSQGLLYSTYLGGPGADQGNAIAVDSSGNAFVTGYTQSQNFPVTAGAFQTSAVNGSFNPFITKLNAGGSKLVYSTYLGGNAYAPAIGHGIAVDLLGNAYVAGGFRAQASSTFPVTTDAFQSSFSKLSGDFSEAFLTKLSADGSALIYSSYLGGNGDDVATAVAIDQTGDAYIAGHTSSANFPVTAGVFQPVMHGTGDAFIAKFPLGGTFRVLQIVPASGGNAGNFTATIFGSGFEAGASVKLSGGQPDIVASSVTVGPGALYITATFNLLGSAPGTLNVVITNADGTVLTLPEAFTILTGGAANVQISKIGTISVPGRDTQYTITVTNTGTSDSGLVSVSEFVEPWFRFVSSNPTPTTFIQEPALFPPSAIGTNYNAFLEWSLPNLAPGASQNVTYVVALDPAYPVGDSVSGMACLDNYPQAAACRNQLGACMANGEIKCLPSLSVGLQAYTLCVLGETLGCEADWVQCIGKCSTVRKPSRGSYDPNGLSGLPGVAAAQWVSGQPPVSYVISFANEPTATAPAQQVVVTNPLDVNLDMSTLTLTSISVPGMLVPIPPTFVPAAGQDEVTTSVDLRPAQKLLVNIDAKLNPSTGLVTWTFSSIDPGTGQPPIDASVGFLPPGTGGSLSFTVKPKHGLATGTQVADQATVVFDSNPPMNTPVWINTIDNTPPVSHVSASTATSTCPAFRVSWSGSDVGSGLQGFTIYVSDTGAPYTAWLSNTTAASADYLGAAGHSYSFYSIATDLTGNTEGAKTSPEASTSVIGSGPCGAPSLSGQVSNVVQSGTTVTATLTLTNVGFTAVQAVNINQMTFRTLSGSGTVTLASPAIPAAEGPLAIGASTTVALTLNVPTTVTRFSLTESGTIKDGASNTYNYSIAQTVIP